MKRLLYANNFGSPSAAAFTPASVSGLILWLKGDAIVGKNDGDAISTWTDSSGQGNDATQATGSKQPLYKTGIINSLPTVRFDNADDVLGVAGLAATAVERFTMFAVIRLTATSNETIIAKDDATTRSFAIRIEPKIHIEVDGGGGSLDAGTDLLNATNYVVAVDCPLPSLGNQTDTLYLNGTSDGSGTIQQIPSSARPFLIGNRGFNDTPFGGDMAEILLYSPEISAGNRALITAYLGTKYGITVA